MKLRRTALYVGAVWLVLFVLMTLMTPAHYVEVSQTAPGATHVLSSGDINGGSLGALLASAVRALYLTGVIGIVVIAVGSTAMGLKPFLMRIGLVRSEESSE
jgi:hypothetical protein